MPKSRNGLPLLRKKSFCAPRLVKAAGVVFRAYAVNHRCVRGQVLHWRLCAAANRDEAVFPNADQL